MPLYHIYSGISFLENNFQYKIRKDGKYAAQSVSKIFFGMLFHRIDEHCGAGNYLHGVCSTVFQRGQVGGAREKCGVCRRAYPKSYCFG